LKRASATAKLNLALVVGGRRPDGKHELATLYQRISLADRIALEPSDRLLVEGYEADTLVRDALLLLAAETGVPARWRVRLTKRVPIAAGLAGGSSDAAAALRLANETLDEPLADDRLHAVAVRLGADVPFFLTSGPQLGTGDGTTLAPLDLPQDYAALLLLPTSATKVSTSAVYAEFDERDGAAGFEERRRRLLELLPSVRAAPDLAALPKNDLARSSLSERFEELGAFRADVSGAGPTVYGLFVDGAQAEAASKSLRSLGRTIVTRPCWYG
jgi:4-diphosphocytidyl-2-C-methyl-D-erythritol kinase